MKKILVVEDNEINMYLCSRIIKSSGYEVIYSWTYSFPTLMVWRAPEG
jgi:CheY-like chemotaxis protein